jgi:hypothetical protein
MNQEEALRIAKAEFDKHKFCKYELLGMPTKIGGDNKQWLKYMNDELKKYTNRKYRRFITLKEKRILDRVSTAKWAVSIMVEDMRYKDGLNTMSVWIDDSTGKIIEVSSLREPAKAV